MSNSKGSRGERELRDLLVENGYAVIRAAGSGSAPDVDLPDLHVGNGTREFAFEVKRLEPEKYWLPGEEIAQLERYAAYFPNAKPRLAVRWDYDTTWYYAGSGSLPTSKTEGSYVLDPDSRDNRSVWGTLPVG